MPNVIIAPPPAQQVTMWRVDRIILTPKALDVLTGETVIQEYGVIVMLAYLKEDGSVDHYENIVLTDPTEAEAYFNYLSGASDPTLIEVRTADWLDANNKVPNSLTCPYIFIEPVDSPLFRTGQFLAVVLTPDAGTAPYTFSIVAGALPTGVTLNTSSGLVSGTPTVEDQIWSVTIDAVDAEGCAVNERTYTGNTTYNGQVVDVQPEGIIQISAGVPFSQTFTASGDGFGPNFTWTLDGGALPPGLSWIDGTGSNTSVIQGTPTGVGAPYTTVYTITAMDDSVPAGGTSVIIFSLV